jgi:2-dehydropantoate 2-reductase
MKKKARVLIGGIGGVGGYLGGHLAHKYAGSEEVEIIFAARGNNYHQILKHGLQIIEGLTTLVAHPAVITNQVGELGVVDFIWVCTKSYDLQKIIEQIQPCVGAHTIIVPLLNGIEGFELLHQAFPHSKVIPGCVYIVSALKEPGVIENQGKIQSFYLGSPGGLPVPGLQHLYELLMKAGLDAHLAPDILSVVWEKFIFISTTASATTYFNLGVRAVALEHPNMVTQLIGEVVEIALAKNIPVSPTIHADTLAKLKSMPVHTTTSMQRDFNAHQPQTELETLTGYVVRTGKELNIDTPGFDLIYQQLKKQHF